MRGTPHVHEVAARIRGIIPAYAGNTGSAICCMRYGRDHPRVCGEHSILVFSRWNVLGSSPRMRGTPLDFPLDSLTLGIIPAYAGNTTSCPRYPCRCRDHPRVCGEHTYESTAPDIMKGSSPRMRGTLAGVGQFANLLGIIPAYAGNTSVPVVGEWIGGDHPRVCGEHPIEHDARRVGLGSSPRMRGTLCFRGIPSGSVGIIPAYAGNTMTLPATASHQWDHPRVCGEHSRSCSAKVPRGGSSPRMRGTRNRCAYGVGRHGIIPAYAGNTRCCWPSCWCCRDHPRVCGEHSTFVDGRACEVGSSPRMRGTLLSGNISSKIMGIIPAYAGNTSNVKSRVILGWDHPRVCGEHLSVPMGVGGSWGSSPRMRGTHFDADSAGHAAGIIPAYAGNTSSGQVLDLTYRDHPRVCGEHPFLFHQS